MHASNELARGEDKKELCLRLGATSFLDYRENNVSQIPTFSMGVRSG